MTNKKNTTIDVSRPEHQKSYSGCNVLKPTPVSSSTQSGNSGGSSGNQGGQSSQTDSSGNKK